MRIVMLSMKDYAGSGQKIAESVKNRNFGVSVYTLERHSFGYPVDGTIKDGDTNKIRRQVEKADVIHFKGDNPPTDNWYGIPIPADTPKVVTVGGSAFRRGPGGKRSTTQMGIYPLDDYFTAQVRTAITPDLNYPDFKGMYTQHCINSMAEPYTYRKRRIPVIMHAPSARKKKGTELINTVIGWLNDQGYKFKYELIENVSNKECIEMKKRANIYIDQIAPTGFYGISAVESMQFGIPTVAYISEQAMAQAQGKLKDCPVINPYMSANSLYEHLRFYLENPDILQDLSYVTKVWCDEFHSYETVGAMWRKIYKTLN